MGEDFSSIAFGITQIRQQFGLDPLMTGVVNAAIMVGSVVGASAGGILVDRFGRYRLFMADMIFFVVAAIGCALAPDEWWLIFFRFVMGIGVGLDLPVAMAFLAEFSSLRGKGNRSQRVNAWSRPGMRRPVSAMSSFWSPSCPCPNPGSRCCGGSWSASVPCRRWSCCGYNAVAYGTPLIISTLFQQGPLITIGGSLVINLVFGVGGGLVGVALVSRAGSRRLALAGFGLQGAALLILAWVGIPTGPLIAIAVLMLAVFIFAQAGGPGAQLMAYATLSYPSSLRGTGVGFNEAVKRVFSIVSLFFFPILAGALNTGVFWIIAIFPLLGLLALLLVRWDPNGVDTDAEEYAAQQRAGG
ncbi:MFS transporter [Microlunatus speluncae]|uniref:MFS transporter n=1 Tax=Microlunatus speluncae TaxID=2594267 RepID=UPI001375BF72|nr:MFS transporter [Microlunatus speluncae]